MPAKSAGIFFFQKPLIYWQSYVKRVRNTLNCTIFFVSIFHKLGPI